MTTHTITLFRRTNRRERVNAHVINVMRNMRLNGYTLNEIARMTDRTVPCVWSKTSDITHANWRKNRFITHSKFGTNVYLVNNTLLMNGRKKKSA